MRTATLNNKVKFDIKKQLEREDVVRKSNEREANRINLREALRKMK